MSDHHECEVAYTQTQLSTTFAAAAGKGMIIFIVLMALIKASKSIGQAKEWIAAFTLPIAIGFFIGLDAHLIEELTHHMEPEVWGVFGGTALVTGLLECVFHRSHHSECDQVLPNSEIIVPGHVEDLTNPGRNVVEDINSIPLEFLNEDGTPVERVDVETALKLTEGKKFWKVFPVLAANMVHFIMDGFLLKAVSEHSEDLVALFIAQTLTDTLIALTAQQVLTSHDISKVRAALYNGVTLTGSTIGVALGFSLLGSEEAQAYLTAVAAGMISGIMVHLGKHMKHMTGNDRKLLLKKLAVTAAFAGASSGYFFGYAAKHHNHSEEGHEECGKKDNHDGHDDHHDDHDDDHRRLLSLANNPALQIVKQVVENPIRDFFAKYKKD